MRTWRGPSRHPARRDVQNFPGSASADAPASRAGGCRGLGRSTVHFYAW